jgi:hypothetical protein
MRVFDNRCLSPERVDLMRMNFLSTEITMSNRNDDMLGQVEIAYHVSPRSNKLECLPREY